MSEHIFPTATRELARKRRELAPETEQAFQAFSKQVFAEGALPAKTKQLIAVAAAQVTQCPYCIRGHTKLALQQGASQEELMEAI
jgi:AhpD family alkylhydroperoxidase